MKRSSIWNKKESAFDAYLKDSLSQECRDLSVSPVVKQRIDQQIRITQKESDPMKKFISWKKVVVATAAACLVVSGGAYAAGHVASYRSGFNSKSTTYKTYHDMTANAKDKLGFPISTISQFSNDYAFTDADITYSDALDSEGSKVCSFPELNIIYQKKDAPEITLDIHQPPANAVDDSADRVPDQMTTCGDITLSYNLDTYKFVPTNYKLTDDDRENEKQPNFFISWGSDIVETKNFSRVSWEMDGIHYLLSGFDVSLTSEELFSMAEELIENGQ